MKKRKIWVSILAGFLAAVMLLSLIVSLIPTTVSAASSSEIKKQLEALKDEKKEIQAKIKEVQDQYDANSEEISGMVAQKDAIDQEIGLLHEQVSNINDQLAAYSQLIADKQDELDAARYHLAQLNIKHKERVRAMEEEGELSYWSIIFKANSFGDLLDRLSMIQEINASDRRRLEEMSAAAEKVATAQEELTAEKADLETAREELDATEAELEDKRAQADQLLTDLIAKGLEFQAIIDESEELQDDLMQQIAKSEKELKAAQYQEWLATYVPPTTKPSTGSTTPSTQAPSSSGWSSPCPLTASPAPSACGSIPFIRCGKCTTAWICLRLRARQSMLPRAER